MTCDLQGSHVEIFKPFWSITSTLRHTLPLELFRIHLVMRSLTIVIRGINRVTTINLYSDDPL